MRAPPFHPSAVSGALTRRRYTGIHRALRINPLEAKAPRKPPHTFRAEHEFHGPHPVHGPSRIHAGLRSTAPTVCSSGTLHASYAGPISRPDAREGTPHFERRTPNCGNASVSAGGPFRGAGFQPAVSRVFNPLAGRNTKGSASRQPTASRRYSRLKICATPAETEALLFTGNLEEEARRRAWHGGLEVGVASAAAAETGACGG